MAVTGNDNTSRINFGMAKIYIGVTNPASNIALVLTSGVPSDGFYIGTTGSEASFKYTPNYAEIMVEQTPEPIEGILTTEHAELDVDFAQTDVTTVQKALQGIGTIGSGNNNNANNNAVFVGGLVVPTYSSVLAVQQRRDDTTKYNFILLYRCYVQAAFTYLMSRTKPSFYKVTFKAIGDLTRTKGDYLFQWFAGV